MQLWEIIMMFLGVGFGVMGLSLLFFGNTYAFAFAEHWLIGGYAAINLKGNLDGLSSSAINQILAGRWLLIIPTIVGFLVFTRWTRFRWAARYPVAVMSGVGVGAIAGLTIKGQLINMISTTAVEVTKLKGPAPFTDPVSAIVMAIGVLAVLTYFLYSITFSRPFHQGNARWISKIGRYYMLAGAGYLWSKIFLTEAVDVTTDIYLMWVRRTIQEVQIYLGLPPL